MLLAPASPVAGERAAARSLTRRPRVASPAPGKIGTAAGEAGRAAGGGPRRLPHLSRQEGTGRAGPAEGRGGPTAAPERGRRPRALRGRGCGRRRRRRRPAGGSRYRAVGRWSGRGGARCRSLGAPPLAPGGVAGPGPAPRDNKHPPAPRA